MNNELEELQKALAKILCLSSLQIGDPDFKTHEEQESFHNKRMCDLLYKDKIIKKATYKGWDMIKKEGIFDQDLDTFDFPTAQELLANINNARQQKIQQCKAYVKEELTNIRKTVDLTQTRSILISSKREDFDDDMLLDCVLDIMHGKGFEIHLTADSRSLGVVLRW